MAIECVECYALSDQTIERVARTLVSEFIGRFGCPLSCSDQGRNFESRMSKEVCYLLRVPHHTPMREWSCGTYEPHYFADTPMLYLREARRLGSTHGYCRYDNLVNC